MKCRVKVINLIRDIPLDHIIIFVYLLEICILVIISIILVIVGLTCVIPFFGSCFFASSSYDFRLFVRNFLILLDFCYFFLGWYNLKSYNCSTSSLWLETGFITTVCVLNLTISVVGYGISSAKIKTRKCSNPSFYYSRSVFSKNIV